METAGIAIEVPERAGAWLPPADQGFHHLIMSLWKVTRNGMPTPAT
jgi:hypothetical protein